MTTNNGSPLQALKFAALLTPPNAHNFVNQWLEGLEPRYTWCTDYCSDDEKTLVGTPYQTFLDANPDEPTRVAADGTVRQQHYGSGRQPWDDIVERGWGPEMAAGNALKYVRRDSGMKGTARERDLKHARWYYARLVEMGTVKEPWNYQTPATRHALQVFADLNELLTPAERALLTA